MKVLDSTDWDYVCTDCFLAAAGYDAHELGAAPQFEPLSRMAGYEVIPVCDENDEGYFSNTPCMACASPLAGDRHAVYVTERI